MSSSQPSGAVSEHQVSQASLAKAEEFIEAEEGAANKFKGAMALVLTLMAVAMSVFHLYTAYAIVPTQVLRPVHVGMVLFLCFLIAPYLSKMIGVTHQNRFREQAHGRIHQTIFLRR